MCCVKNALYTTTRAGCSALASKIWLVLPFLGRTNLPWAMGVSVWTIFKQSGKLISVITDISRSS